MASATSRVTAQNQTSIPSSVRKRFHIGPGSELVWEDRDGDLVVRLKRFTLEDLRSFCAKERRGRSLTAAEMRAARDHAVAAKYGRR